MAQYYLSTLLNTSGRTGIQESNNDLLDTFMQTYHHSPTDGNTNAGPPTTGTYIVDFTYVDNYQGNWRCLTAGTPGTWIQDVFGTSTTDPTSPVTGYIYENTTDGYRYRWSGAAWVRQAGTFEVDLPASAAQGSVTTPGSLVSGITNFNATGAYSQNNIDSLRDLIIPIAQFASDMNDRDEALRTAGITSSIWKGAA